MGEVITFTSGKGDVGKTTTTANVGAGLSLLDKKVVLVDTDIGLRNSNLSAPPISPSYPQPASVLLQ